MFDDPTIGVPEQIVLPHETKSGSQSVLFVWVTLVGLGRSGGTPTATVVTKSRAGNEEWELGWAFDNLDQ
jgi:hypothetical protein